MDDYKYGSRAVVLMISNQFTKLIALSRARLDLRKSLAVTLIIVSKDQIN